MKKILIYTFLLCWQFSFGQGGTWTWVSGSNAINSTGIYGTQGVPSVNNHPPGLYEPAEWKDKQGNFWIYGGFYPNYSDLWKYNPITKEWTWVKGKGLTFEAPVYGTKGVADIANTPGQRQVTTMTWVDTSGAFWLFGGDDARNDLWKYDIGSNQWTWMSGSNTYNAKSVHGTKGIASSANTPGAREETSSAWTDSLNNLWLFGGWGFDENGNESLLNDLWKYNIVSNQWTWMYGSAFIDAVANYGTKGIINAGNDPGARQSYTKWKDSKGNFWLMGGLNSDGCFNDVWKYDVKVNEWTWMSGTDLFDDSGHYQTTCLFDSTYLPYSRFEQRSSVSDNCGRFWLFGGENARLNKYYNDLWVFNPQNLKWSWISGSNIPNQPGNYGTLGVPSLSNMPSSRRGAAAWWGNDHKLYMFGGSQNAPFDCYSDVWVFNPDTNCIPLCNTVTIALPTSNFQGGKTSICANDCISFTNLSTNATSWQWSFPGGTPSFSTDENPHNICYLKAGIYDVTLIATNAGGSDVHTLSNYITVLASPPTPVITQVNHDTLYCSTDPTYTAYQWYLDSTLLPGATDTMLVVTKSGNYNVKASNENGCSIAVGINFILSLQNYGSDKMISLSPNPAGNQLAVNSRQSAVGNLQLAINNILGQRILQIAHCPLPTVIDVSSLPSGIYFVEVISESGRWVGKFVKE